MKVATTFTHIRVAAQEAKVKRRSEGSNESAGNAETIDGAWPWKGDPKREW